MTSNRYASGGDRGILFAGVPMLLSLLLATALAQTHVHPQAIVSVSGVVRTPAGDRYLANVGGDQFVAIGRDSWSALSNPDETFGTLYGFADVDGDGFDEVFFLSSTYELVAVDAQTDRERFRLPGVRPFSGDVATHDIDGDGDLELLGNLCDEAFCVREQDGTIVWELPDNHFDQWTLVQADADPELEVLTRDLLRDVASGTVVGSVTLPADATAFAAADVDGDGLDDLSYTHGADRSVRDVRTDQVRWTVGGRVGFARRATVVDLDGDGLDDFVFREARALVVGDTGAQLSFAPPGCGYEVLAATFDPGEPAYLLCLRGEVAVDVHGNTLDLAGGDLRHATELAPVALNGSATPDVVALGIEVSVFSPNGTLRSSEAGLADNVALVRLPDGTTDLARIGRGLVDLVWRPRGLVDGVTFLQSNRRFNDPRLIDDDADGRVSLYFRTGRWWSRVDLGSGALDDNVVRTAVDDQLAELDSAPGVDVVARRTARHWQVETGAGVRVDLFAEHIEVVDLPAGTSVLLATVGDEAHLYDLAVSTMPVVVEPLPLARGPVFSAGGRLWYQRGDAVVGHALDGRPDWVFDTPLALADAPVLAGPSVWLLGARQLERWDRP